MRIKFLLTAVITALLCTTAAAAPASPRPFTYVQPDGSVIRLQKHGDEFFHWNTLAGSNQVMALGEDGWWRPTTFDESAWQAGQERRNAVNDRRRRDGILKRIARPGQASTRSKSREIHIPVLLLEFPDRPFSVEDPRNSFDALLNQPGYSAYGAIGSVRDYYIDNSNGAFRPVFDVYGPVTLPEKATTYVAKGFSGSEVAFIHGAQLLDDQIDFTQYDADQDGEVDIVFFFFAGFGGQDENHSSQTHLWPNTGYYMGQETFDGKDVDMVGCTSELYASGIPSIATFCHEFAHALGLPDLYPDAAHTGVNGEMYEFSLMCSGNYLNEGRHPPSLTALERIMLGWMSEEELLSFPDGEVSFGSISGNVAYRNDTDNEGEYFLFECRDGSGWDASLPKGMFVYHIDQSATVLSDQHTAGERWEYGPASSINNVSGHPCCYVVPAGHQSWDFYDEPDRTKFVFPGSLSVTSYSPMGWGKFSTGLNLSDIRYSDADRKVHLVASLPSSTVASLAEMGFNAIEDPGNGQYAAGTAFPLRLELAPGSQPQSVSWTFDGNALTGIDTLPLPAGAHTLVAVLRFPDGTTETLELTLEAK